MSAAEPVGPRPVCFLHVGLPKSGTSFLQSVFWDNRAELARQGLGMLPARAEDHFFLALKLRGLLKPYDDPRAATVLERLAGDVARVSTPRLLVSQEALAPTTREEAGPLLELLAGFELHVIVTARDLARQLPSAWQQRVQARLTATYPEFLRAVVDREPLAHDLWLNQDLGRVLDVWGASVPPDRIHVVTSPRSGDGSLLDRFCSVVGVDPSTLQTRAATGNRSLGYFQAELLRRVNVALGDRFPSSRQGYGRLGKVYLAGRILQRQQAEPLRLPPDLLDWCTRTSSAWVAQIRSAGHHLVGDEDDLLPSADAFAPLPQLDAAVLLDVATTALADVLEVRDVELDEQRELRDGLRQQATRIADLERQLSATSLSRVVRAARRRMPRRPTADDRDDGRA